MSTSLKWSYITLKTVLLKSIKCANSFYPKYSRKTSSSSSLETTQASTSHNSVSQTLDHIFSVQTEFVSAVDFSLHTKKCDQVSVKQGYEMLKPELFPRKKKKSSWSTLDKSC